MDVSCISVSELRETAQERRVNSHSADIQDETPLNELQCELRKHAISNTDSASVVRVRAFSVRCLQQVLSISETQHKPTVHEQPTSNSKIICQLKTHRFACRIPESTQQASL